MKDRARVAFHRKDNMKPEFPIPHNEQDNVMGAFWALLKESEGVAKSPVEKLRVEQYFSLWSRVTGSERKPYWS